MTMRPLTHRLKQEPFLTGQNVELMGISRTALTRHPMQQNAWSTIFVTRRLCWSVQKPLNRCGKTHSMVVHQNILSTVMLKTVKLSYENARFRLSTPDISQVRNSSINARTGL